MFGRYDAESFWPKCHDAIAIAPIASDDEDITGGDMSVFKRPSAARKQPSSSASSASSGSAHRLSKVHRAKLPKDTLSGIKKRPSSAIAISKSTQITLVKMRYSKTGAIGIRERGGRQLMQILPVKEFADFKSHQDVVVNWADECIHRLENGATITDVKAWVEEQKMPLIDEVRKGYQGLGDALVQAD